MSKNNWFVEELFQYGFLFDLLKKILIDFMIIISNIDRKTDAVADVFIIQQWF